MQLFRDTKIDFMKYRRFWVTVSGVLVVLSLFTVVVQKRLNLGIDFAGGTQLTIKFQQRPEIDRLRAMVTAAGVEQAQIQRFGGEDANEAIIKTPLQEGSEEGSRDLLIATLDGEYNPDREGGFDLNRNGRDALTDLLTAADPDGVGSDEPAATHYSLVAGAVIGAREELGLFSDWGELDAVAGVSEAVRGALREQTYLGHFAVLGSENVGPQIGSELRRKGVMAVVLSLVGMLAYIWFRFELRFGIGALVAVTHDVLITVGLFALSGFEFNLTTIAGFLTLVGYSVNDTVVVFDRVRENLRRSRSQPLEELMNLSINQTLSRTVLTSGTTLLTVGSILFAGGDVLRGFAFILTIGVVVGTYSSIYVASPFALLWENLFGREARTRRKEARAA